MKRRGCQTWPLVLIKPNPYYTLLEGRMELAFKKSPTYERPKNVLLSPVGFRGYQGLPEDQQETIRHTYLVMNRYPLPEAKPVSSS